MADLTKLSEAIASIRDLVEAAEAAGWDTTKNKTILQAGRDAYAALQTTVAATAAQREALQLASGALLTVTAALPDGENSVIRFTGQFEHLGRMTIADVLDRANSALEPEASVVPDRPVLVPPEYQTELSQMSKAELMDGLWRLSAFDAGSSYDERITIMVRIRIAIGYAQDQREAKR